MVDKGLLGDFFRFGAVLFPKKVCAENLPWAPALKSLVLPPSFVHLSPLSEYRRSMSLFFSANLLSTRH